MFNNYCINLIIEFVKWVFVKVYFLKRIKDLYIDMFCNYFACVYFVYIIICGYRFGKIMVFIIFSRIFYLIVIKIM